MAQSCWTQWPNLPLMQVKGTSPVPGWLFPWQSMRRRFAEGFPCARLSARQRLVNASLG